MIWQLLSPDKQDNDMYVVQKEDLFGFRDEFAANHPHVAFAYMQGLEYDHGKQYRIIKKG